MDVGQWHTRMVTMNEVTMATSVDKAAVVAMQGTEMYSGYCLGGETSGGQT